MTLRVDYTGAVTIENIDKENLALFFFGTAEDATIASASGQTEDFTASPKLFYQLGATASEARGRRKRLQRLDRHGPDWREHGADRGHGLRD